MKVEVTTEPAEEPVTLGEAKAHMRVDSSDEDALISSYIKAARSWAEGFLGRSIVTQTRSAFLDEFPDGPIELLHSPVQSVSYVKYYDISGSLITLDASKYIVDTKDIPPKIHFLDGESWPDAKTRPNAVEIQYVAGYGLPSTGTPKVIPSEIALAIKHLVATWYSTRESVVTGTIVSKVPQTCEDLLWPLRIVNFG